MLGIALQAGRFCGRLVALRRLLRRRVRAHARAMRASLEAGACPALRCGLRFIMAGMETIAIIGGGASGLMAAVEASLALRQAGAAAHVALFEADPERIGRSILATGNGRCNISNACISADAYRNQAFVGQSLMHLQNAYVAERGKTSIRTLEANPVLERFADMGLVTREEPEGRLYPMANKATSVLDVLRGGQRIASERGELLFRDYGVSGVSVFNLSRFAQPGDDLVVDFLPDIPPQDMERFMMTRRKRMQKLLGSELTLDRFLEGLLLPAVSAAALRQTGLRTGDRFAQEMVPRLCGMLKGMRLTVEGIGDERQCQVRRGGFPVERFSPAACESLEVPGLFVTGEALDVDAPCGGFNLHWAWSSGMLAGRAAADRILSGEGVGLDGTCAPAPAGNGSADKRSPSYTGTSHPSSSGDSRSQAASRSGGSHAPAGAGTRRSSSRAEKPHPSHRGERSKSRNQRGGNAARNAHHRNR